MGRKPREFDNSVLPKDLVNRMARGLGCVQCGRKAAETYQGYACCGATQCREQLRWIKRSHKVSESIKKRSP